MPSEAHIYAMSNGGVDTYRWLDAKHVAEYRTRGWTARSLGPAPSCDRCEIERQGVVPLGCGSSLVPVSP